MKKLICFNILFWGLVCGLSFRAFGFSVSSETIYDSLMKADYRRADSLAAGAPSAVSVAALASHLTQGESRQLHKVRGIFRWITLNVNYDVASAMSGRFKDNSSPAVMRSKLAVCEGYSNLFRDLCKAAGIECIQVRGFGKGFNYKIGQKIPKADGHAWNAVNIDGKWFLTDVTWAAGYIQNGKFVKHFTSFYFLSDPELFILNHYPQESKYQYLPKLVSLKEFEDSPHALFIHNFKPVTPKEGIISKNKETEVKIFAPECEGAIVLGGEATLPMERDTDGYFSVRVKPKEKEMSIGLRTATAPEGKYDIVLVYRVK